MFDLFLLRPPPPPPGKSSQWKGTVLDQVPVNPSLYLIKYDGFDCVYGLELYSDERVVGLEVLPDRVGEDPLLLLLSRTVQQHGTRSASLREQPRISCTRFT